MMKVPGILRWRSALLVLALAGATPAKAPAQVAAPVALHLESSRAPRRPSVHATVRPWRPHYIGFGVLAGALVGAPVGWAYARGQCEGSDCDAGSRDCCPAWRSAR